MILRDVFCGLLTFCWPYRDTAEAFSLTMAAVLERNDLPEGLISHAEHEYKKIKCAFLEYAKNPRSVVPERENPPPPRTYWETIVKEAYGEDISTTTPIKHPIGQRFMEEANCVYHFNYAATFEAQGLLFDVSTAAKSTAINYCIPERKLEGKIKPLPLLKVPNALFEVDPILAKDFIRNSNLIGMKNEYLSVAGQYLETLDPADHEKLEQKGKEYEKELIDFMPTDPVILERLQPIIGLVVGGVMAVATWSKPPVWLKGAAMVAAIVTAYGGIPVIRQIAHLSGRQSEPPAIGNYAIGKQPARQIFLRPVGERYGTPHLSDSNVKGVL